MTLVVSETQQVLQRINLDIISFISTWLIRHRFKQGNFISRCCINFISQLMQLKHISDPSVFIATNNAVEIRLNNSDRFLYMQHISDHHLSIYLLSSNHLLKHNLSFIYCSISLTLPVDPRIFPLNKRGSNERVKEIEQYPC